MDYYEQMKNTFIKYSLICGDYTFNLKGTTGKVGVGSAPLRRRKNPQCNFLETNGQSVSIIDLLSVYQETPFGLSECVRVLDHEPFKLPLWTPDTGSCRAYVYVLLA